MTDIGSLKGITREEVERLRRKKIVTVDDLWQHVGLDLNNGIDQVAELTDIERDRLIELLTARGVREAEVRDTSWLSQHTLDVILIVGLAILSLLILRARGVMVWFPSPLALQDTVVVATRDLKSGRVLRSDDLYSTRLVRAADHFTTTSELKGLILAEEVSEGKPIRFEDVLRPQVIAASDILSGSIIVRDAITLTWSTYQPDAAVQLNQVVNHKARKTIRSGEIILPESIDPDPALVEQVAVSAAAGLPAFHIIDRKDVELKETLEEPGAYTLLDDVVGRYPLQAIPPGKILRADHLSTARLSQADIADRKIVSVPIQAGAFSAATSPGARVSLLFSPRERRETSSLPLLLDDVIVLAVDHDRDAASLVIAVTTDDLQLLIPVLGVSEVFILQPMP